MNKTAAAAPVLAPGRIIGGCQVIREIKRGGMGCVHLARHLTLKRQVAVKTILPFMDDDDARKRFFREAEKLAQVKHPNVVAIHNAGEENGVPFFEMEYVEGKNLKEYQEDHGGPLPWPTVLRVMRLAVGGLGAMHRTMLVHRDVKPSNIMVSTEGRVLLMDFGLVREVAEPRQAQTKGIVGTPEFMSPEQCEERSDLDPRSDIFSIGSTLYKLLTGTAPFGEGKHLPILAKIAMRQTPAPVHLVNNSVPEPVSALVARAMAFEREDRFQSAGDLKRAMGELLTRYGSTETQTGSVIPRTDGSQSIHGFAPELAPLELVNDDPSEVRLRSALPRWLVPAIAVGAACASLAVLVLVLNAPVESPLPPGPSLTGMVKIEEGDARMGVSVERVMTFIRGLDDKYGALPFSVQHRKIDQRETSVPVPLFYMDKYEVTNEEYLRFVTAMHHPPPPHWASGHPGRESLNHPVTGITFADADAYARWAKKKLPSVAQWMRAFHGNAPTLFPTGDEFLPDTANIGENKRLKAIGPVTETPDDKSPFGVCNLLGNVSEMTSDTIDIDGSEWIIIKGGNALQPGRFYGIGPVRDFVKPGNRTEIVGFRCVYEPPEPKPK